MIWAMLGSILVLSLAFDLSPPPAYHPAKVREPLCPDLIRGKRPRPVASLWNRAVSRGWAATGLHKPVL